MKYSLLVHAACLLFILTVLFPAASAGDPTAEPGVVTILAIDGPEYYPGQDILFSGTNTGSDTTYLFITGPNLPENGSQMNSDPSHWPVIESNSSTFRAVTVGPDDRWSWIWITRNTSLSTGIYMVYAVSRPHDKAHLEYTPYGTTPIIITKTPSTPTALPRFVVTGQEVIITGTADCCRDSGVAVWIMGPAGHGSDRKTDFKERFVVSPDAAGSFSLDLNSTITGSMEAGDYHVVVQYPGTNNAFDLYPADSVSGGVGHDIWVMTRNASRNTDSDAARVFKLEGAGSLRGDDAYYALEEAVRDPEVNADDRLSIPGTLRVLPEDMQPVGSGATVTVSVLTADPAGNLTAGMPVTATCLINFPAAGDETFPSSSELLVSTELENSRWTSSLVLDAIENPQPEYRGRTMPVSGWVLSYPSGVTESLAITLNGTVPPGSSPANLTLFRVAEFDEKGNPAGRPFVYTARVNPPLPVIPDLPGNTFRDKKPLTFSFANGMTGYTSGSVQSSGSGDPGASWTRVSEQVTGLFSSRPSAPA